MSDMFPSYGGLDYLNSTLPSYSSPSSSSGSGNTFSAFGPGSLTIGAKGTGNNFVDAFSNTINGAFGDMANYFRPEVDSDYSPSFSGFGSDMSDFGKQALLSVAPSLVAGLVSTINNSNTNETNFRIAQDNLDYQRAYNDLIFQREDNAIWRRAQDLKAAGLSQTLAAGSAAGSGGSTKAPSNDYSQQADVMTPQLLSQLGQTAVSNANALLTMYQTAKANEADIRLKNAQAAHQSLINANYAENSRLDSELKQQAIDKAKLDYDVVNHDFQFAQRTGLMHSSQGVIHDTAKLLLGLDQNQWRKFGDKLSSFGDLLWSSVSGKFPNFRVQNLFSPEYAKEQLDTPGSNMRNTLDKLKQFDEAWSWNGQ